MSSMVPPPRRPQRWWPRYEAPLPWIGRARSACVLAFGVSFLLPAYVERGGFSGIDAYGLAAAVLAFVGLASAIVDGSPIEATHWLLVCLSSPLAVLGLLLSRRRSEFARLALIAAAGGALLVPLLDIRIDDLSVGYYVWTLSICGLAWLDHLARRGTVQPADGSDAVQEQPADG